MIDGHDGAQDVEELISEDWSYIAQVVDCGDELVEQMLQDQRSPSENFSSITVTED